MLSMDSLPVYAVRAPSSAQQACALIKSSAGALRKYRVMYDLSKSQVDQSDILAPDVNELRSETFWNGKVGIPMPRLGLGAHIGWKWPRCDFDRSREETGVRLTFYQPLVSPDGRRAVIVVGATLGAREHLPGIASEQRFPTYVCRLRKAFGRWTAQSCSNAYERLF